jgi:hypothetical protein
MTSVIDRQDGATDDGDDDDDDNDDDNDATADEKDGVMSVGVTGSF